MRLSEGKHLERCLPAGRSSPVSSRRANLIVSSRRAPASVSSRRAQPCRDLLSWRAWPVSSSRWLRVSVAHSGSSPSAAMAPCRGGTQITADRSTAIPAGRPLGRASARRGCLLHPKSIRLCWNGLGTLSGARRRPGHGADRRRIGVASALHRRSPWQGAVSTNDSVSGAPHDTERCRTGGQPRAPRQQVPTALRAAG